MTIGERIKDIRLSKGLTQEDLALAADTTKQTIYKYENNIVTNIPSDKIEAIADRLGVSAALLMGWEDSSAYKTIMQAVSSLGLEKKLLADFGIHQEDLPSISTRELKKSFKDLKKADEDLSKALESPESIKPSVFIKGSNSHVQYSGKLARAHDSNSETTQDSLSRDLSEVRKALDLYQQYLSALPHERAAVDALLKFHGSEA